MCRRTRDFLGMKKRELDHFIGIIHSIHFHTLSALKVIGDKF